MAVTKIGINFTKLNNLTFPSFNSSQTAKDMLQQMPNVANQQTNYFFGWGVLITMFFIVYSRISDSIVGDGLGFGEFKSLLIASSITSTFGLLMAMIGYLHDFKIVGIMTGIVLLTGIIMIISEYKHG